MQPKHQDTLLISMIVIIATLFYCCISVGDASIIIAERYTCLSGAVKIVETSGATISDKNDDICRAACKKEPNFPNYEKGNWALMSENRLDCCCGRKHFIFDRSYHYREQQPVVSIQMLDKMEQSI